MMWQMHEYGRPCSVLYGGNGNNSGASTPAGTGGGATLGGAQNNGSSPNNSSLPASLANFGKKERDFVDDFEKNGPYTKQEIAYMNGQLQKIINENDFAMRVEYQLIEKIMKTHFMNQMEIGSSNGALNPNMRARLSADYFGHSYTTANGPSDPDFFEKYGYLAPRDKVAAMNASADFYGDTIIRFRREDVIHRTTFKTDDTLNSWYSSYDAHASWLDNPTIAGVSELGHKTYSRMKKAERFIHDPDVWADRVSSGSYFELQFHGHLSFSDVESVTFSTRLPSRTVIDELKTQGIEVYQVIGGVVNAL